MILFEDGRQFQIAGAVLSDGTTIIPIDTISLLDRPSSFPISPEGITPPIIYATMDMGANGKLVAAMSVQEYNKIALALVQRDNTQNVPFAMPASLARRTAEALGSAIGRACGSCGRK